jgi:cytoskeletal protein CcmA (bactofilin family)
MFSKTADPTSAPTRPAGSGGNATRSVLSADLKISGEITSTGAIDLLGEVDGNIIARSLVIGGEGRLTGTVRADQIEVKGRLDGSVGAGDFTLRASAQVSADVAYSTLVIESGAQIEGRFARTKG